MQHRRWLFSVVVLAVFAMPALAQEKPVNLSWKFEKDKTFYQEMTTKTEQTMKVMGQDIKQNQTQKFVISWSPVKQEADKSWVVKQKIESVMMDIDIGGNRIQYDSSKDAGSSNPLADFFKALVGSEFTITIGADMKVSKIEGRADFLTKLTTANPQMKQLLEAILSDDALKQMADATFAAIPNKEVKKGDTWSKESKLNMGPVGSYNTTYKYTYEGTDAKDKVEKIKVETTLAYTPPVDAQQGALPFKIKAADLKSDKSSGTVSFDAAKGRIESSTMTLDLKGKLSIEIAGMTTDVELTQTQTTTVKTTDKNPVEAKK